MVSPPRGFENGEKPASAVLINEDAADLSGQIWMAQFKFSAEQPLTREQQERQKALPVERQSPDRSSPAYPGVPHDSDKQILGPLTRNINPAAGALYQLYLKTYTDRSGENKVPKSVQIAELHPGVKDRVKTVDILGDSEMFEKNKGGRMLHPDGIKRPGDFYTVLSDKAGDPVNIIDYAQGKDGPKYLQQWIFNSEINVEKGLQRTTITQFAAENQPLYRPKEQQGNVADVYTGKTEYIYSKEGRILSATKFNAMNNPEVAVDYTGAAPVMKVRDPNSGQLRETPYHPAQLKKLAFTNLYLGG